jgi:hypothetical protein
VPSQYRRSEDDLLREQAMFRRWAKLGVHENLRRLRWLAQDYAEYERFVGPIDFDPYSWAQLEELTAEFVNQIMCAERVHIVLIGRLV